MAATTHPARPSRISLSRLIAAARFRARRRRRRNAAVVLVACAAGLVAILSSGGRDGTPPGAAATNAWQGSLALTLHGKIESVIHRHGVTYTERGRLVATWIVPRHALVTGRAFPTSDVSFSGTATYARIGKKCSGASTTAVRSLRLTVGTGTSTYGPTTAFRAVNPLASLVSPSCPAAASGARWRLRGQSGWVFRHPGWGFYGPHFRPIPKGGGSEGFGLGFGAAGKAYWLTWMTVAPARYRDVLIAGWAPIPRKFEVAMLPCINNWFAACRRQDSSLLRSTDALSRALAKLRPPRDLVHANLELMRGLSRFHVALAERVRYAREATAARFSLADDDIITALNALDRATHDLNHAEPTLRLVAV